MRRIVALLVIGTAAAAAGPHGKPAAKSTPEADDGAVVRVHVEGLAALDENPALADDAIVIAPGGEVADLHTVGCTEGVANAFYGCIQAGFQHALGPITVVRDAAHHVAWFLAPYRVTERGENPDTGKLETDHWDMRATGIVDEDGNNLLVAMHARVLPDRELLAGSGGDPAKGTPKLTGDAKLAQAAAGWLASGLAAHASKDAKQLIASGTAPGEFGAGARAVALARGWDKLRLGATTIDAKLLAHGALGWVRADVMMPRKSGKGAVEMILGAIAVPSPDGWRWVSLQFLPPYH